jgi:hypothetical protein
MVSNTLSDRPAYDSHLFVLRMWPEDLGAGRTDWRGKVQHGNSGEARYFRDWPTLEAFVKALLPGTDTAAGQVEGTEETHIASQG